MVPFVFSSLILITHVCMICTMYTVIIHWHMNAIAIFGQAWYFGPLDFDHLKFSRVRSLCISMWIKCDSNKIYKRMHFFFMKLYHELINKIHYDLFYKNKQSIMIIGIIFSDFRFLFLFFNHSDGTFFGVFFSIILWVFFRAKECV